MSNIVMNSKTIATSQTPIEIALQVDAEGKTTAKRLYEFLELDSSNYSRWAKVNILDNSFAEKNVDFMPFVIQDERNPKPTTDYTLTASFAKKLAMGCQNARGEQARDYFVKVEDKLKQVAQKAPHLISDLERTKIEAQKSRADAMLLNAKNRTYRTIMSSIDGKNLSPIAIQVFGLKGLDSVFGVEVGNYLPEVEKTYTATEIGEILGITANRVGKLANANNLKTDEYGIRVMDKSPYSSKELPSFRYSVGIEIIESGDRKIVLETAAEFVALKLNECDYMPISCVKQHYEWIGKNCPRILIDKACIKNNMDWNYFIGRVDYYLKGVDNVDKLVEKRYQTMAELPEWAKPAIQKLLSVGRIADANKLDLSMDMIRILVIINR